MPRLMGVRDVITFVQKGTENKGKMITNKRGQGQGQGQGQGGCSYECNGWPRAKDLKGCKVSSNLTGSITKLMTLKFILRQKHREAGTDA